jgi:hypothetical protein
VTLETLLFACIRHFTEYIPWLSEFVIVLYLNTWRGFRQPRCQTASMEFIYLYLHEPQQHKSKFDFLFHYYVSFSISAHKAAESLFLRRKSRPCEILFSVGRRALSQAKEVHANTELMISIAYNSSSIRTLPFDISQCLRL